jgi:hypothetical protein
MTDAGMIVGLKENLLIEVSKPVSTGMIGTTSTQ